MLYAFTINLVEVVKLILRRCADHVVDHVQNGRGSSLNDVLLA